MLRKNAYESPIAELIALQVNDVITNSPPEFEVEGKPSEGVWMPQ